MALKKPHIIAAFSILTALIVLFAIQRNKLRHLQEQNFLHDKSAQSGSSQQKSKVRKFRLPAPHIQSGPDSSAQVPNTNSAELYAQFHVPKLSIEQAEKFPAENQRSPASLAAAFRTSGDEKFLAEAMQFPSDPHVAFEALFKADLSPEERRKWADALKRAAPDNPLANYQLGEPSAMRWLQTKFGPQ